MQLRWEEEEEEVVVVAAFLRRSEVECGMEEEEEEVAGAMKYQMYGDQNRKWDSPSRPSIHPHLPPHN